MMYRIRKLPRIDIAFIDCHHTTTLLREGARYVVSRYARHLGNLGHAAYTACTHESVTKKCLQLCRPKKYTPWPDMALGAGCA